MAPAATHALALLKGCGKAPMKDGRVLQEETEGLSFLKERLHCRSTHRPMPW
jgi:hypothetical protein